MPLPSPTTTSAVKLNLRPPLTTLATRLMVTTRSRYTACFSVALSRPRRSSRRSRRSPPPWPPRRGAPGISCSFLFPTFLRGVEGGSPPLAQVESRPASQRQPAFAHAVRECGHAAVVLVAAPIEYHGGDARALGALGEERADKLRLGSLVAVGGADARVQGG